MDEVVYLRSLEASDLENCYTWHNDSSLYEMLIGPFRFVSREAEQAWLGRRTAFSPSEINLAICIKESGKHIGNIYLREIDWIYRRGQMGIFIGENRERAKGYGKAAVRQLLSYAFFCLGLKKIFLSVLADNKIAIKLYEKCGFSVEGRLKNHVFKRGEWRDVIMMGLCCEDFNAKSNREKY
jgi:RimJ/RimL family protein N-acetyltransferase